MSNSHASASRAARQSALEPFQLTLAVLAAALLAAGLAAPAAHAAAAAPAAATPAAALTGYSLSSGAAPPHAGLRPVPYQPVLDATSPAPALGRTLTLPQPRDASTGLFLAGPISFMISGSQVDLRVGDIINERPSGTSGALTLDLVATTTPPPVGAFTGALLASISVGTLAAQTEIVNFNMETAFTGPSAGCYYLSLVLLESGDVVDVRTVPAGGTPETTGYSEFGFGQTCPAATTCTRTATSVCLDSARFQLTVAYDNTATGAGVGQVLLFGSTRAESDESGFFYFTDASNFELGAKVLDACTLTNTFWVFIGGLTNQGWSLNVLDTKTGHVKFYGNTDNVTTVTTTDTAALPCP